MAYTTKSYIDINGLNEFLSQLKTALAANTTANEEKFKVNWAFNAARALGDEDGTNIKTYYLKAADAANTYVPQTFAIGDNDSSVTPKVRGVDYLDFTLPISVADLNALLGTQANTIENIGVTEASGSSTTTSWATPATVDGHAKAVVIDLSNYAKLDDITSVFTFKGIVATVAALPSSGMVEGDVYHVTEDDGEYVYIRATGTEGQEGYEAAHWELISHNLSNYYTKNEVYTKAEVNSIQTTLQSNINAIYTPGTPASGTEGQEDYVPAVAASGYLAQEITRATAAETSLQNAINTLNGADSVTGSIAQKVKSAIEGLDVSEVGGSTKYISAISEVDGKISATASDLGTSSNDITNGGTKPVTGGAVYSYIASTVTNSLDNLDLSAVGDSATASYVKVVSQNDGQLAATAGAFDTAIPDSNPSAVTAPTTAAVSTGLTSVYNAIGTVTSAQIDALFTPAQSGS